MHQQIYRAGKRRLRDLLPAARAQVSAGGVNTKLQTALAKGQAAHVTEDNLDALIVYPGPVGGWHADILFKRVPPGVPNAMGSKVEKPFANRKEAEAFALPLLVSILEIAEQNKAGRFANAPPAFLLFDYAIELSAEIYAALEFQSRQADAGYGSPDAAAKRVEEILAELCPNGFVGEEVKTWAQHKQARLLAVLHTAAISGLFAYPQRIDLPPVEMRH